MKYLVLALALLLGGCSNGQSIFGNSVPSPSPGQWVCWGCSGMSVAGNGSFNFPNSSGAVGYIYTGAGNLSGKTITLTYTVSGPSTVLPNPASGYGDAQVRLFLWRRGDDRQCTATTEWYRQWSTTGAGPLTAGTHTITAVVTDPGWTDCLGKSDSGQLAATAGNLVGAGFSFGAEFYGHGAYSTGQNSFAINSFTVN